MEKKQARKTKARDRKVDEEGRESRGGREEWRENMRQHSSRGKRGWKEWGGEREEEEREEEKRERKKKRERKNRERGRIERERGERGRGRGRKAGRK